MSTEETPLIDQLIHLIYYGSVQDAIAKIDEYPESVNQLGIHSSIDGHPRSLLIHACRRASFQLVDLILKLNPKLIYLPDPNGSLPIHWSASGRKLAIVKRLLKEAKNKEEHAMSVNNFNRTPLWYAVEGGSRDIIEYLLKLAPSAFHVVPKAITIVDHKVNILNENGAHVAMIALKLNSDQFMKLCRWADTTFGNWIDKLPEKNQCADLITTAICYRMNDSVRYLLQHDFPIDYIDSNGRNFFHYSYTHGISEEILSDIENRYVKEHGKHGFILAVIRPEVQGWTPWHCSLRTVPIKRIHYLASMFENVTSESLRRDIHDLLFGSINCSEWCSLDVKDKVGPKFKDPEGYSCLGRWVARHPNSDIEFMVRLLSHFGTGEELWSILHAQRNGRSLISSLLLSSELNDNFYFLVWLGAPLINTVDLLSHIYGSWLPSLYALGVDQMSSSPRLSLSIPEEDILKIRHRTYFERSLTARLLYFGGPYA